MIKSRKFGWAGYVTHVEEMKTALKMGIEI
jgi:hypothetical protein